VIEQSASDIQNLSMPVFVSWRARRWLKPGENLYFIYTTYTGPLFGVDARKGFWEGATLTYVPLQVACYPGF